MMGVQAASAQLFYDFCLDDLQRPPKGGGDRRSREPPKGDRPNSRRRRHGLRRGGAEV